MKARLVSSVMIAVPAIVLVLNYGLFQNPANNVLERDDRNRGMAVRAHWRWYVDPTVLVYDLREAPEDSTGIDVLRAFLQFAYKQKERHFTRVDLAWRAESRFSITGADFAELGRQYANRSPVETMAVMPGLLLRPDGTKAFPDRALPFVQQHQQRLLDFVSFVNAWVKR
jgi:hypothetical protein